MDYNVGDMVKFKTNLDEEKIGTIKNVYAGDPGEVIFLVSYPVLQHGIIINSQEYISWRPPHDSRIISSVKPGHGAPATILPTVTSSGGGKRRSITKKRKTKKRKTKRN